MKFSLRRQLLVSLLITTVATWTAIGTGSIWYTRKELQSVLDAQLAQSAWVLLSLVHHEMYEEHGLFESNEIIDQRLRLAELQGHLDGHKYESDLAFQISARNGAFRFHSVTAPQRPLSTDQNGFSETVIEGDQWRVFTQRDETGGISVRVGERLRVRQALLNRLARHHLMPVLLGLPMLIILIGYSVNRSITALTKLTESVQSRNPTSMDPITELVPSEVKPLVDALNTLLRRLREQLDNEKRFTADAAHELRTPLAALRAQAQVASEVADDGKRQRALRQIMDACDRTARLIEQLLALARLDGPLDTTTGETVALEKLAQEVAAAFAAKAIRKNIDIHINDFDEAVVHGSATALTIMLQNLIDNAVNYTPHGGRIAINVLARDCVRLIVSDSGPGIALEERQLLFQRFYRGRTGYATGTGLGLSIVQRVAEAHGASIRLDNGEMSGLRVTVTFQPTGTPTIAERAVALT